MCNKSLDMIDLQSVLLTDNQKAQFKAEVRAIRAMMYYEAMSSSPRIFAVLFSPLLRPVPSSSRYLSEVLPSMASWFRIKDMRQWNSQKLFTLHPIARIPFI